jgi:hypothetical protein
VGIWLHAGTRLRQGYAAAGKKARGKPKSVSKGKKEERMLDGALDLLFMSYDLLFDLDGAERGRDWLGIFWGIGRGLYYDLAYFSWICGVVWK